MVFISFLTALLALFPLGLEFFTSMSLTLSHKSYGEWREMNLALEDVDKKRREGVCSWQTLRSLHPWSCWTLLIAHSRLFPTFFLRLVCRLNHMTPQYINTWNATVVMKASLLNSDQTTFAICKHFLVYSA